MVLRQSLIETGSERLRWLSTRLVRTVLSKLQQLFPDLCNLNFVDISRAANQVARAASPWADLRNHISAQFLNLISRCR